MIDLYTFFTPNGRKVSIALEEMELPYRTHLVDIGQGDQFKPEFTAINPNSKIPAIVDHDAPGGEPLSLFESGAILIYLAEKSGRFLPEEAQARAQTLQWLMFQMGGVGPMFGQMGHFVRFAPEQIPYGIERYTKESKRLMGVMNRALQGKEGLAGAYSIADMATFPWVAGTADYAPELLTGHEHVKGWLERVGSRPAVKRGMNVPAK